MAARAFSPASDALSKVVITCMLQRGMQLDHLAIDNVTAAADLTRHLIDRGRCRIAAIGLQPHLANGTADRRAEGYRRALAAAGLPADPALEIAVERLHRLRVARRRAGFLLPEVSERHPGR